MAEQRGREMQSLQERVAYLEGRAEDHGDAVVDLRGELRDLRSEMNRRFEHVDTRIAWLIGIQVTSLVALFGAIAGLYLR